jgi:hypothetical protein
LLYVLLLLLLLLLVVRLRDPCSIHSDWGALVADWALHATAESGTATPLLVLVWSDSGHAAAVIGRRANEVAGRSRANARRPLIVACRPLT